MIFGLDKSWFKVLALLPWLLVLGGTNSPNLRELSDRALEGKISLTLDKGIWKLREEEPVYQPITLDLVCHQGKCESEIWGYAPRFNKDVDHQGTVEVSKTDSAWQLQVHLDVQSHPGNPNLAPATYNIEIVPYQNQFLRLYFPLISNSNNNGQIELGIVETANSSMKDTISMFVELFCFY